MARKKTNLKQTKEITLRITYVPCLREVLFEEGLRRKVITKGRRLGLTQCMSHFLIEQMLQNEIKCMWGDTVSGNIRRYIQRYWMPILKQLPSYIWEWQKQDNIVRINKSICDFRSADRPENWEGFGYHYIFLNEAGIILEDRYLWENAVRPMLLDFPKSVAIVGGTPKGKNLFYELWEDAKQDKTGRKKAYQFSSYENPFIDHAEIDEMKSDLPGNIAKQEIYGEFVDVSENYLFPYNLVWDAMHMKKCADESGVEIWGLDVARGGDDFTVLAKRRGLHIYELIKRHGLDTMEVVTFVSDEVRKAKIRPHTIFVDTIGIGAGVYDRLNQLSFPVFPATVSNKATRPELKNMRCEMFVNLQEKLKLGLKLVYDRDLLLDLTNLKFLFDSQGKMYLEPKDKLKQRIGRSPDAADAAALTCYTEVAPNIGKDYNQIVKSYIEIPSVSAW